MGYKATIFVVLATVVLLKTAVCDDVQDNNQVAGCTTKASANESVALVCHLKSDIITWQKGEGDKPVDIVSGDKYTIDSENQTLVIKKAGEDYSGRYICTNGTETERFVLCVYPYVKQYDKAKNVIEGDPFQSECSAWGFPPVAVQWSRKTRDGGEQILVASEDIILKSGSCENSTLRIKSVKNEDAGIYTCEASSDIGRNNATITVNVKDKLAALWPFLGICAEVAILCIIIFFYERRRAKRLEKEAASEEADRMNVNNDTRASEEVRHRK